MNNNNVILFAFEERDNLGMGYLASALTNAGYNTNIIDFREPGNYTIDGLKKQKPILLGFSVIFQYHIDKFIEFVRYLKRNSIDCHYTAGGHYASLRPRQLLDQIPELDSLVRFEGEYTLLELVKALASGKEWKTINGISFLENVW
ncbi:MAG TPA: hypothetical protein DEQ09_06455 [Bacteroidales bacterium]|nr:hypothetical protein [Bacteroidales bacterium]